MPIREELYLPPVLPDYNLKTGQFKKGHVPYNKGKKWSEYMTKRAQKRCAKGWKNLDKFRPTTRPDTSGRCRRPIIAVMDDGKWLFIPDAVRAHQWLGKGTRENIGRCCRCNEERRVNKKTGKVNTDHRYTGIRFYFDSDSEWMKKIKQ